MDIEVRISIDGDTQGANFTERSWAPKGEPPHPALDKLLAGARRKAEALMPAEPAITDDQEEIADFFGSRSALVTGCCGDGPSGDDDHCEDCPETLAGTLKGLDARLSKLEQGGVPIGRITVEGDGFKQRVNEIARERRARP